MVSKKAFMALLFFAAAAGAARAGTVYENSFRDENCLEGFSKHPSIRTAPDGLTVAFAERVEYRTIDRRLPPERFAGRLLRVSCEARGEDILTSPKEFEGIKLEFSMKNAQGKGFWGGVRFPRGTFDWQRFEAVFAAPEDPQYVNLAIGMQNSAGTFQLRNLKVECLGVPVQIRAVANRELRDEVAGDSEGGWTDQGPKQDGRCFSGPLYQKQFAGIPIDAEPEGKGVLAMHSRHLPSGPKTVAIPVKPAEKARTFYLLHTLAWGVGLRDPEVGVVTLRDRAGKEQNFPVLNNQDVADWFRNIAALPNAYAALRGRTGGGEAAGVYLSRFDVSPDMGEIVSVGFRANPEGIWLILGATLSAESIPLPAATAYRIDADDRWLPVARAEQNRIRPGSALDLSGYMPPGTVDELGRVVIRDGHFVFENEPDRKVRFLAEAMHPGNTIPKTRDDIERFAEEIRRNGYNMVRTHFLDADLLAGMDKPCAFNPEVLDRIDYFIACMKKNGIYLNFDCMTSWIGYTPGVPHLNNDPVKSFKSRIFHDPDVRKNWREGVEKFLCRVNPYTQTRLVDDPVLVMAVAYNEQEFGFWRDFDAAGFLPQWREFLKRKYGTIEKLQTAWKKDSAKYTTFDEIPCFRGYGDVDAEEFLYPLEEGLLRWYERQLREMGYQGPVVNYNCGKNMYFNLLRKESPLVAMNHYHAHPSDWISKYSFINQHSCIGEKAITLRNFIGARQPGKPYVVTEHNFAFWNRFRYEQGFVIGGYAAFQDFDALTLHASPVAFATEHEIRPFGTWLDPIAKASEFLTYFLFIRRDVAAGKPAVRIRATREDVFSPAGIAGGLSDEQSLPALLVGESVECVETTSGRIPLRPGEIAYQLGATSRVAVDNAGFSGSADNPAANMAEVLAHLRQAGAITSDNRSDGKTRFESGTRELYLDSSRTYMQIDTPRLQGVCAPAGTRARLSDLEIVEMDTDGNLAVVGVDGMKRIAEADRLVLVYATNALNSGMEFTSREMTTLLGNGKPPALLRRGAFVVSLNNRNAEKLKLYPLDLAGNRLKEIAPSEANGRKAVFAVDTGKDGISVFFEIAVQ